MRANRIEELATAAKSYPLLADLPPNHLPTLLAIAEEREFEPNEIIFPEGVRSDNFFLIASGRVALELMADGRKVIVQTLGPGDAMGWSALTETATTHFQARALSNVETIAFEGAKLLSAFEYDLSFGYELMKRLLALAAERLDQVRMQIIGLSRKS